uniref:Uncharacterized protein n=1 Tax=Oryza australiensis TaxID=4532 RepID=A0A1V1H786_9ORYZ|nr:hypothetical protein [Oryza australiensis]
MQGSGDNDSDHQDGYGAATRMTSSMGAEPRCIGGVTGQGNEVVVHGYNVKVATLVEVHMEIQIRARLKGAISYWEASRRRLLMWGVDRLVTASGMVPRGWLVVGYRL